MLKFLDEFVHSLASNLKLGSQFCTALVNAKFDPPNKSDTPSDCAYLRMSLASVNMTSPEVDDGVGRLFKDVDILKLQSKKNTTSVYEANRALEEGYKIVNDLLGKKCMNQTTCNASAK